MSVIGCEGLNFMLYASPILFEPHMSEKRFEHWLLFYRALHISYGSHTTAQVSLVSSMRRFAAWFSSLRLSRSAEQVLQGTTRALRTRNL
jgi:hypothetical protein